MAEVAIEVLPPSKLAELTAIGDIEEADLRMRLTRGDRCYIAYLDGKPAHYSWVQQSGRHSIDTAGIRTLVAGGEFWIYNCRTAASARGHGLYPRTILQILADQFAKGFTAGQIYTTSSNIASQHGIARAGFILNSTASALRIGHRYFPLKKTLLPESVVNSLEPDLSRNRSQR